MSGCTGSINFPGSSTATPTPTQTPTSAPTATPGPTPTPQVIYVTVTPSPTPQVIYVTVTPSPTPQVIYVTPIPTQTQGQTQGQTQTVTYAPVDQSFNVQKNYSQSLSLDLAAGTTLRVNVSTTGGAITFMAMNSDNYNKYGQALSSGGAGSWSNYIIEKGVISKSYSFTAPSADRYYFVMDNTGMIQGSTPVTGAVNVRLLITWV